MERVLRAREDPIDDPVPPETIRSWTVSYPLVFGELPEAGHENGLADAARPRTMTSGACSRPLPPMSESLVCQWASSNSRLARIGGV